MDPMTVLMHGRRGHLQSQREQLELSLATQYSAYATGADADMLKMPGLLHMYQFDPDERIHVAEFLERAQMPIGSRVLDVGCGNGRLATLMQEQRPDLNVTLLNRNHTQLGLCPKDFPRIAGNMHALPVRAESFDTVILAYTLGYGLVETVLAEVSRVLKPGGELLLYDVIARQDLADYMLMTVGYKCYALSRMMEARVHVGFVVMDLEHLDTKYLHPAFRDLPEDLLALLIAEVAPIYLRLRKL